MTLFFVVITPDPQVTLHSLQGSSLIDKMQSTEGKFGEHKVLIANAIPAMYLYPMFI